MLCLSFSFLGFHGTFFICRWFSVVSTHRAGTGGNLHSDFVFCVHPLCPALSCTSCRNWSVLFSDSQSFLCFVFFSTKGGCNLLQCVGAEHIIYIGLVRTLSGFLACNRIRPRVHMLMCNVTKQVKSSQAKLVCFAWGGLATKHSRDAWLWGALDQVFTSL